MAQRLRIDPARIALLRIVRRSIDARGRSVRVNLGFEVYVDGEQRPPEIRFDYPDVNHRTPVVVVGSVSYTHLAAISSSDAPLPYWML